MQDIYKQFSSHKDNIKSMQSYLVSFDLKNKYYTTNSTRKTYIFEIEICNKLRDLFI
jgi:ribosomal protein L31